MKPPARAMTCARSDPRARIVLGGSSAASSLWQLWLTLAAPGKVGGEFKANAQGRVNVLVTLRFEPERFHVLVFQQHGRVSGTQDASIEVRGVRKDGPDRRGPALTGSSGRAPD